MKIVGFEVDKANAIEIFKAAVVALPLSFIYNAAFNKNEYNDLRNDVAIIKFQLSTIRHPLNEQ